jgi:hypothetical protein
MRAPRAYDAGPMFGRRSLLSMLPAAVVAAPAGVRAESVKLILGTAAAGGTFVLYAQALMDVLRSVDSLLEIHGKPTKGSGENVRLLEAGDVDLALVSGEVAHEVMAGLNRPAGKLKVVTVMYSTPGMFVVLADSRYRSILQLKGRPVVWNLKGSGFAVQARYVMDGIGLDMEKDFEPIWIDDLAEGPAMVLDGRAAALWGGGSGWPGFRTVMASRDGGRFIAPDAGEIQRILARHKFLKPISQPAGSYPGQDAAITSVGSWSFVMVRPGLDDAVAERLAKALHQAEGAASPQLVRAYYRQAGLTR